MKRLIPPAGARLAAGAIVTVAVLFAALISWAVAAQSTDRRLCDVLHDLVARSGATIGKPGTPGYAYYHAHPDELELARKQNAEFLVELNCQHLPTGG